MCICDVVPDGLDLTEHDGYLKHFPGKGNQKTWSKTLPRW